MKTASVTAVLSSLVLACLLAPPTIGAQDPPIAPDVPLYAHAAGSGATKWMNTVKDDANATDTTVTVMSSTNTNTPAPSSGEVHFPLLAELDRALTLDKGKDILFNIRFGVGTGVVYGKVSTTLKAGTTIIASAAMAADTLYTNYQDVKLTAKPQIDLVTPEMGNLVWSIRFDGRASSCFLQVKQSSQYTHLILPGFEVTMPEGPAEPRTVVENLTGPALEFNLTAPNATSDVHVFHWAGNLTAGTASLSAEVENGSFQLDVVDGNNQSLVSRNVNASGGEDLPFGGAAPGDWVVTVNMTAFVGTVHLRVEPPPVVVPADNESTPSAAGNASAADDKGRIPGPPAPAALAGALVAAAVVARRRRNS